MRRLLWIALAGIAVVAAAVARRRYARDRAEQLHPLDALAATLPAVDDLTRDELYAWAKRLDIPGRSRMRKSELAEALRHPPPGTARARGDRTRLTG
jgi:hypothetical protein